MKLINTLEASRNLSDVLAMSLGDELIIKGDNGNCYRIIPVTEDASFSPFEIPGKNYGLTQKDILDAVRLSRDRSL